MGKFIVFFALLFVNTAHSATADVYNYYQWNRVNHALGNGKVLVSPWYEWWYYKVVLPETGESFYSVYGVVNPWDIHATLGGTRSYVGFGNFSDKILIDRKFDVSQFSASYDSTKIQVGDKNSATDQHFEGELQDPIFGLQRWSVNITKKWSYNAMGWAMGIPRLMNISWYPAQADAVCSGRVESNGKIHDFTDAPCYQDRNWGSSFPDWWAWVVSNHFNEEKDAVLAVGGGLPEILGHKMYSGVSIGFKWKGREYTFRPNDLNKVHTDISWGKWNVSGQNAEMRIEIEATAPNEKFMDLQFETPTGEIFHDYETLTGHLVVRIYDRLNGDQLTTLTSDFAGIEYGSKNEHQLQTEMMLGQSFSNRR